MEKEKVGYKKPPKHSQFKKGQVANPNGGRLFSPRYIQNKRLTQEQVSNIMQWVGNATAEEIKQAAQDPETPALKLLIAKCYAEAIKKGDSQAMERLLARMIGPVKQQVEISQPKGEAWRVTEMTDEQIAAEMALLAAKEAERNGTEPEAEAPSPKA